MRLHGGARTGRGWDLVGRFLDGRPPSHGRSPRALGEGSSLPVTRRLEGFLRPVEQGFVKPTSLRRPKGGSGSVCARPGHPGWGVGARDAVLRAPVRRSGRSCRSAERPETRAEASASLLATSPFLKMESESPHRCRPSAAPQPPLTATLARFAPAGPPGCGPAACGHVRERVWSNKELLQNSDRRGQAWSRLRS